MNKYSNVIIRGTSEIKKIRIGSDLKPEIIDEVLEKWQSFIDTAAHLTKVPSALIMRLKEDTIEVFLKSNTEGNPYKKGEEAKLIYGLYCETVIGTQKKLLVPDATKSNIWRENNPDVDINMISYLGFPINWPDKEVFGTVCLLDNKENPFCRDYENLLHQIKQHIEDDLKLLVLSNDLEVKNIQLQELNNTKHRFLSLISHDIRGSVGIIDEFITMILTDFDEYNDNRLKEILKSLSQIASSSYETLDNLLNWSKNDFLQLLPNIQAVDLICLIEKILAYFKQSILMKGIEVVKSYYSNKAIVNADENMITVAIRNIISNAIKYNHRNGKLEIQVSLINDRHEIIIKDTGVGMNKEFIEKLFKYNVQHTKGTQGEGSAGIGLILAKEFLDKLGANILVYSQPNKGTTFKIEI
jgi:signal transduction histidine kinase